MIFMSIIVNALMILVSFFINALTSFARFLYFYKVKTCNYGFTYSTVL